MGLAYLASIPANYMISHFKVSGGTTQHTVNRKENVMKAIIELVVYSLTYVAIIVFAGLFLSLPVWYLWNSCLVPAIPGIKEIGWIQAWGIMILCEFLFKYNFNSTKTGE